MSSTALDSAMTGRPDSVLDDVIEDLANRIQSGDPVDPEAILATIRSTPSLWPGCCRRSR